MGMTAHVIPLPQGVKSRRLAGQAQASKLRPKKIRHLTDPEVNSLIAAAKRVSRHPHRDATMILMAYRHGLRVSEVVDLTWDRISFEQATVWVDRAKGSKSGMHPISGTELRALRQLRRESPSTQFVFTSKQGVPLSVDSMQYMMRRCGEAARLPVHVHPHMLRHACGYHMTNKLRIPTRMVQEWLGHVDIDNTLIYTEVDVEGFRHVWR